MLFDKFHLWLSNHRSTIKLEPSLCDVSLPSILAPRQIESSFSFFFSPSKFLDHYSRSSLSLVQSFCVMMPSLLINLLSSTSLFSSRSALLNLIFRTPKKSDLVTCTSHLKVIMEKLRAPHPPPYSTDLRLSNSSEVGGEAGGSALKYRWKGGLHLLWWEMKMKQICIVLSKKSDTSIAFQGYQFSLMSQKVKSTTASFSFSQTIKEYWY